MAEATLRTRLKTIIAVCVCLLAAGRAAAQCVTVKGDVREMFRSADWLFAGTLLKNERNDRLTFQVDETWKGPNQAEAVVYAVETSTECCVFMPDTRYVIFAKVLSPEQRHMIGPLEAVAYGTPNSCGTQPPSLSKELDKLARPKKPKHR